MNKGISGGADLGLSQRNRTFLAILVLAFLAGAYCGAIITNKIVVEDVTYECNKWTNTTEREPGSVLTADVFTNIQFEPISNIS